MSTPAETSYRRHPIDRIGIPKPLVWGYVGLLFFMIGDGVETSYLSKFFGTDLGFSETGAARSSPSTASPRPSPRSWVPACCPTDGARDA